MRSPIVRSISGHPAHGLARVLSKVGYCSRAQAHDLILAGRVCLNGRLCANPEHPVDQRCDRIEVDGQPLAAGSKLYLMLNKPRGLVTTRIDEQGRRTVYSCFEQHDLPWLSPVGRLDRASEGLILFTNDTAWADRILAPASHIEKTYHVQIDCLASPSLCQRIVAPVLADGQSLSARRATVLRLGTRNSWLQIVLDEGKNRQIRRLLEAIHVHVLRLIRVAVGPLQLGTLPKGQFRHLTSAEVDQLAGTSPKS